MSVTKNSENSLNKKSEADEQADLIKWVDESINLGIHPELKNLYSVPNGGSRNKIEACNLKRQGLRAGVPDLCLAYPKGCYHGLYIEMKVHPNKTTAKQDKWLKQLSDAGYAVKVCYGAVSAKVTIERYLGLGDFIKNVK